MRAFLDKARATAVLDLPNGRLLDPQFRVRIGDQGLMDAVLTDITAWVHWGGTFRVLMSLILLV